MVGRAAGRNMVATWPQFQLGRLIFKRLDDLLPRSISWPLPELAVGLVSPLPVIFLLSEER